VRIGFDEYIDVLGRHVALTNNYIGAQKLADIGLDSLQALRLIIDLEETFEIRIADVDLTRDAFLTVMTLWDLVKKSSTLNDLRPDDFRVNKRTSMHSAIDVKVNTRPPSISECASLMPGICKGEIDERALQVISSLQDAGHLAYIVGGAVRDLLCGVRPKDFDVVTSASAEEVQALFRRSFIVGKYFRVVVVHVFGRKREHEIVEVTSFQTNGDAGIPAKRCASAQDAAKRDFSINAMYYDPRHETVVDYYNGVTDIEQRILRTIGDPSDRIREDPVRILRAVRIAVKLGFDIHPDTLAGMKCSATYLPLAPQSRLLDETIKLLQTGRAQIGLEFLQQNDLHHGALTWFNAALGDDQSQRERDVFLRVALASFDRLVAEGEVPTPSFILSCLMWWDVVDVMRSKCKTTHKHSELPFSIERVIGSEPYGISSRSRTAADMRAIWLAQEFVNIPQVVGADSLATPLLRVAGSRLLQMRIVAGEIPEWSTDRAT